MRAAADVTVIFHILDGLNGRINFPICPSAVLSKMLWFFEHKMRVGFENAYNNVFF